VSLKINKLRNRRYKCQKINLFLYVKNADTRVMDGWESVLHAIVGIPLLKKYKIPPWA